LYVLGCIWLNNCGFSLYFVVQAPQVVRSSISPTGLVDPSETQWSLEFDRQVRTIDCSPSTICSYFVAPT